MLSKGEIEKAKDDFRFFNEGDYITKEMSNSKDIILEYIEQLETDKQKLVEKLEKDIVNANDNIKHMEEKNILQIIARELAIGMRDYAQEILELVKGENNV